MSKTKINLLVDTALFLIFLIVYQEKATGNAVHEWLGVGIAAVIMVHILLHWDWVVNITRRFFQKIKSEPRINYIVNTAIFIGFTTIVFSGLMISRTVLPFLGLEAVDTSFWKMLHVTAADITLWLTALHIALHWRWIVDTVKRYVVLPLGQYFSRKRSRLNPGTMFALFTTGPK